MSVRAQRAADLVIRLWGKMQKTNSGLFHPLVFHLLDTACVTGAIWRNSFSVAVRGRFAESLRLSHDSTRDWLVYLCGLHDIGKASPGFQSASPAVAEALYDSGLAFPKGLQAPHGVITTAVVEEWLGRQPVGVPEGVAHRIATALGGHHGKFPSAADTCEPAELGRVGGRVGAWDDVRQAVLASYTELVGSRLVPIPADVTVDACFLLLLAGLTSVADWIASSDGFFPYETAPVSANDYLPKATERAEKALDHLGWRYPTAPAAPVEFADLFELTPRTAQRVTGDVARGLSAPGMVLIEAPMGEGKTEAAFHLAESWLRALGQQGCYAALPTIATANAIFSRFRDDYLSKVHPEHSSELRLLHGRASISDEYLQLRTASVYDCDDSHDTAGSAAADDWFSYRKRGLLSPYAIGTVDQALLGVLRAKHGFVRLFGLAGKTVIIDEVHAFDVYTRTILERLLEWLAAAGSSVVILSATLPKTTRDRLVAAYGGRQCEGLDCPYPRVTTVFGGKTDLHPVAQSSMTRRVEVKHLEDEDMVLVERLRAALSGGGCAVYVCNTVKRAQEFYCILKRRLGPDFELGLFHARYPFGEREARERDAVGRFGKNAGPNRPRRSILVATQVVEQSLDVDFDLVVSDLAPVDLVLQRSGRLFRHARTPRWSIKTPELWIRTPAYDADTPPDFGADAAIYSDYVLLRSLVVLRERDHLDVPVDVEELIETVYDDSRPLDVSGAFARRLESARKKFAQRMAELARIAKERLIKRPEFEGELAAVAGGDLEDDNPDAHRALQALTRWSDRPSVSLVCLHGSSADAYFDADLTQRVDLGAEPDDHTIKKLIARSVTLAGHSIAECFAEENVPAAWRRLSVLRHHRLALFVDGVLRRPDFMLCLDPELGIVIERRSPEGVLTDEGVV